MLDGHSIKGNYIMNAIQPKAVFFLLIYVDLQLVMVFFLRLFFKLILVFFLSI